MDFVKNKIILRSIVSSIAPIFLYSMGFLVSKVYKVDATYGDPKAWLSILAVSVLYPLNQLALWLFFGPIEYILYRNLKVDIKKNPILRGNFKPVQEEKSYDVVEILEGKVPTDINGVYLRNGPNAKFMPDNNRYHWFDGDSMIHALRIKNGKMFYCNRYTKTPKLMDELSAGKATKIRAGELFTLSGLIKAIMFKFQAKIGYLTDMDKYKSGVANTAFAHHVKKTYALVESDFPFHIRIDRNEKDFDIKSIGHDNFDGELNHNVSAHPKVDRKTGEMMAFGYDAENGLIHYSLINKLRKVVSNLKIPISSPRMIHDFMITENYVILPDLPMELRPDLCAQGKFIFHFDQEKPARYGIMKRNSLNPNQVQWFELPNHYVFHFVNAWEETNDKGEQIIRLYGCTQTKIDIDFEEEHPFLAGKQAPKLSRFLFNLTTGASEWKIMIPDISMEFPVIEQNLIGYKNQYAYLALFQTKVPENQTGQDNVFFEAVVKYDLQKEQIVGRIDFGETRSAGEVFYHKRDGADPKMKEDDGYLMSFVYDWKTEKSEFVMWDAQTMSQTPVMRAECKSRIPNGFHTFFVQEDDLE